MTTETLDCGAFATQILADLRRSPNPRSAELSSDVTILGLAAFLYMMKEVQHRTLRFFTITPADHMAEVNPEHSALLNRLEAARTLWDHLCSYQVWGDDHMEFLWQLDEDAKGVRPEGSPPGGPSRM